MAQVLGALAWPGVVLVLGLVFFVMFRVPIAGLLNRTRKLGRIIGLETFETQPAPPTEKSGVEAYLRSFDNPILVMFEDAIRKDLRDRNIETALDREKALVRVLASTQIVLRFKTIHEGIWASQKRALDILNVRPDGVTDDELMPLYEAAKEVYPRTIREL
jgi:hypothetical protein